MLIYFTLLIALIGLLMYALSTNGKVVEIGRIMFWTGLLSFLLTLPGFATHTVSLFGK